MTPRSGMPRESKRRGVTGFVVTRVEGFVVFPPSLKTRIKTLDDETLIKLEVSNEKKDVKVQSFSKEVTAVVKLSQGLVRAKQSSPLSLPGCFLYLLKTTVAGVCTQLVCLKHK